MASYLVGTRLPEDIERGALGGPRFNTSVLELDSGFEKRNVNWSMTRGEWDIGFGLVLKFQTDPASLKLDLDELIHFFYTVNGKAYSWRMKDWSDFEIAYENGSTTGIARQFLAFGDDTTDTFQAFKRYTYGVTSYDRYLTKLVDDGSIEIAVEGVTQTESVDYTVDYDRAEITFSTPPASTGGSGPGGEEVVDYRAVFDCHVRLDSDDLKVNMEVFSAGSWPNIPVVELLGNGLD